MLSKLQLTFLILLFFIGLFIRVYQLQSMPFGFHDDELDAGYIGRYILLHGEDFYGNKFPLYFDKLGDFRPTGIFYLSGAATFLLGNTEFAVRFPSALFGAVTIFAVYFLTFELFGNKKISLGSAILLTFLPWHIVLSRATSEGIIGLFFLLCGMTLLVKYKKTRSVKIIVASVTFFLLSYFFYHSFRFIIPFLFLPVRFYLPPNRKEKLILSFCCIGFFALNLLAATTPWGAGRFSQVVFYKNPILPNTIDSLIFADGASHLSVSQTRIFHNKLIIYSREFLKHYFNYFSPEFLFTSGGLPLRYAIPEQGLLFFSMIPFLLVGLVAGVIKYRKATIFVLFILTIAPFAAALTYEDSPNMHRSFILLVPLIILSAVGLSVIITSAKNNNLIKIFMGIFLVFLAAESLYFFHQYAFHAAVYKSVLRKEGNREVVQSVLAKQHNYMQVIMPLADDITVYYLFFGNKFGKLPAGLVRPGNKIDKLDNVTFTQELCPSSKVKETSLMQQNILVVDTGDCSYDGKLFTSIEELVRKDSTYAFRLLEPIRQ